MRLGKEFRDLDDVRYLLRSLNVTTVDTALEIVGRCFDLESLVSRTQLALEELPQGGLLAGAPSLNSPAKQSRASPGRHRRGRAISNAWSVTR